MDIEIKLSDDGFQAKDRLTDIPYKVPELYYTHLPPIYHHSVLQNDISRNGEYCNYISIAR